MINISGASEISSIPTESVPVYRVLHLHCTGEGLSSSTFSMVSTPAPYLSYSVELRGTVSREGMQTGLATVTLYIIYNSYYSPAVPLWGWARCWRDCVDSGCAARLVDSAWVWRRGRKRRAAGSSQSLAVCSADPAVTGSAGASGTESSGGSVVRSRLSFL